jgi:hypothetical protein
MLENASNVGGDSEVIRLLHALRERYEVHLVGRNQCDATLSNVVNHWAEGGAYFECPPAGRESTDPQYLAFKAFLDEAVTKLPRFDAWVVWLGQHGSSLHPIPAVQGCKAKDGTTSPLISLVSYGYPVVHAINAHDATPIWLCPDPRNTVKFRDVWNTKQRPVLAQYRCSKSATFYDERDGRLKTGSYGYQYAGIELLAVPPCDSLNLETPRRLFGIMVNEGRTDHPNSRLELTLKWLKPLPFEWEIFGTWTPKSQAVLGREVYPVPLTTVNAVLTRWKTTITFPAFNTGWATAKPWECFAAGTLCFRASKYDDQNHIYGPMPEELRNYLTLWSPERLRERLAALDDATWQRYAVMQWEYLLASRKRLADGAGAVLAAIETSSTS